MKRTRILICGLATALAAAGVARDSAPGEPGLADGERLYNGIMLPEVWPPQREQSDRAAVARVPYLEAANIPKVIPIDVGRQLFVDDFLIEQTDLQRTYHAAKKYEGNPVLTSSGDGDWRHSTAGSQHGGAFYDPFEKCFKIFYTDGQGDFRGHFKVAYSQDGINWTFPELGLHQGLFSTTTGELLEPRDKSDNTILLQPSGVHGAGRENSIWLDHEATDPARRYKFLILYGAPFSEERPIPHGHYIATLDENYRFSSEQLKITKSFGDYLSIAYNPFRKKWVQSLKIQDSARGRARRYLEHDDFLASHRTDAAVFWADADERDVAQLQLTGAHPDPRRDSPGGGFDPQLYSLNMVGYESIMLGAFQILRSGNLQATREKIPKTTDIHLGYSRDGFHFFRPEKREAFLASTHREGTWDRRYHHLPTGLCTVVGDRLYFFFTAFSGVWGERRGMYAGYAMGLATLRRDGFASMDATDGGGTLTTRPLSFQGRNLFVNVDCPKGELQVELLDASGRPIAPFTRENCVAAKVDSTLHEITWKGEGDLAEMAGQPVRMRFTLKNGKLYSFWVSPDASGASHGYVAAGGPGFPRNRDTVGRAAYRAVPGVVPSNTSTEK